MIFVGRSFKAVLTNRGIRISDVLTLPVFFRAIMTKIHLSCLKSPNIWKSKALLSYPFFYSLSIHSFFVAQVLAHLPSQGKIWVNHRLYKKFRFSRSCKLVRTDQNPPLSVQLRPTFQSSGCCYAERGFFPLPPLQFAISSSNSHSLDGSLVRSWRQKAQSILMKFPRNDETAALLIGG